MLSPADPRHLKRRKLVGSLFAATFHNQPSRNLLVKKILAKHKVLDQLILKHAPEWPLEKINRLDLAILRLAIYEIQDLKTPPKVVIDEAVELAKEYGSEGSSAFVNGVLGAIYEK